MADVASRRRRAKITGDLDINVLLAFIFGVAFVAILLVLAVAVPNPSLDQLRTFRTILALAAAGVGAVIPGFLHIKMKGFLRAGGALALFVVVYFFSPSIQAPLIRVDIPTADPAPAAESWLRVVDAGDLGTAWNTLDSDAKRLFASNDRARFETVMKNGRLVLGKPVDRKLVSSNVFSSDGTEQNMPPKGAYASFTYITKFAGSGDCRTEVVVLRANNTLDWVPFMHQVSPVEVSCAPLNGTA